MTNTWQEIISEFNELFQLDKPLPKVVVNRALQDEKYLAYLVNCREDQKLLDLLINDSKNINFKQIEDEEVLNQKKVEFLKFKKGIYFKLKQKSYIHKYNKFFEEEMNNNPEAKACKPCAEINPQDFREVYLDHNATTYIRSEVTKILVDYYNGKHGFYNPSSNTVQGLYSTELIQESRRKIANCLSASPNEIFFTGSGSEANNLAIKGIAFKHLNEKGHIITSKVEHSSILEAMRYLETIGFSVTYLDVDKYGMVSSELVSEAIKKNTILIAIMAANNEIGTINPIKDIGEICKKHNIPFMVDGIQAFCKMPLNPKDMGISLLSFSGHKIYASKGIGGLYVEQGINLIPQIHGGGQEAGMRSGTESVGNILALGEAARLAYNEMEQENKRMLSLREFFLRELAKIEPDFMINGSLSNRLSNNLSIAFPGVDSGALLRSLNKLGISASAGSACSSKQIKNSHVLEAIGADTENYASIRFSFGLKTVEEDLEYLLKYLKQVLSILRN